MPNKLVVVAIFIRVVRRILISILKYSDFKARKKRFFPFFYEFRFFFLSRRCCCTGVGDGGGGENMMVTLNLLSKFGTQYKLNDLYGNAVCLLRRKLTEIRFTRTHAQTHRSWCGVRQYVYVMPCSHINSFHFFCESLTI